MEWFEQRFAIKFLFTKGLRSKAIHIKLEATLGATMYPLTQEKGQVGRFKTGGFSCQDGPRPGRPSPDLADLLRNLRQRFPFASYKFLAGRLTTSKVTVTRVLRGNLSLRKNTL
jgi:hypothetical protein